MSKAENGIIKATRWIRATACMIVFVALLVFATFVDYLNTNVTALIVPLSINIAAFMLLAWTLFKWRKTRATWRIVKRNTDKPPVARFVEMGMLGATSTNDIADMARRSRN